MSKLSYEEEDYLLEEAREKEKGKFTLVVDCGIPYEEKLSKKKLMKELKKLSKKRDEPYCDVWVYKGKKDVTNSIFKQYHKKRRK